MAAKKVVPLATKEKPQASQAEPHTLKAFRNRTPDICRHISTYGEIEGRTELYHATTKLLTLIASLFFAAASLPDSDEEAQSLCMLGEDLAREAQRRVDCLYEEV